MPSRSVNFFSTCGLGDCILHAHWMRHAIAANPSISFGFFVRDEILHEIWDVLHGVPRNLGGLGSVPQDAIEVPLHAKDMPQGIDLGDFIGCKIWQYGEIARRIGIRPILTNRADWLLDYPELGRPSILSHNFDVLVINAAPRSGQWLGYYPADLGTLVADLSKRCRVVTTHKAPGVNSIVTDDYGLSVTQIGNLSLTCRAVVAVATGPIWPTFNKYNLDSLQLRVVLIDRERVDFAPNTVHAATIDEAKTALAARGFL